ncbi:virion structural protein [Gordonia phage GTE8]|uniref:Putative major tail protein n=1 Tax=Gordonia phage GTE8 TaxID=1647475 RepID=A0A0K0N6I7_9CAUD|nr:virion structural protein [Gordonia phage GTE8]AKJ72368.1 putative major tail protein [Gordonia phage GTE8]
MAFEPIQLVHPKTGAVVTATTAVDLTNFRFNDGYVLADQAEALVKPEGGAEKHPKLAEGLKVVADIRSAQADSEEAPEPEADGEKADAESEKPGEVSSPQGSRSSGRGAKTAAKSGTDASGNDVGVS